MTQRSGARYPTSSMKSPRRGPYRILYDIDDVIRIVAVIRIAHRADVYR